MLSSLSVILKHSEPYSRVKTVQLWYNLSLVLVLYWDDFHMLFSIHKVFLALLKPFLMSLFVLPSCLTVLPREVHSLVVGRSLFTVTGKGFATFFFWLAVLVVLTC